MLGRVYGRPRGWRNPRRFRDRPVAYVLQWAAVLGLLAGGGALFYRYLQRSAVFSVRWVQVQGARVLDPQEVLRTSGITTEDNLVFLDAVAVRSRLEALPHIKTCRVDRLFPDRVLLALEERAPVATLLACNRLFALDPEAVVLCEIPAHEVHPGPLVTNVPGLGFLEPGQQLTQREVSAALAVWDAFYRLDMASDVTVSELAALGEDEILMYCDELPFEFRWGRRNFASQARLLDILWRETGRDLPCEEYLDLRFDGDLVCK